MAKLQREVERLGESLLVEGAKPAAVVKMITERGADPGARREAALMRTAPSVVDLEVRQIEKEAMRRLADVKSWLSASPEDAPRAIEALLDGPITATPLETSDGWRLQLEGKLTVGHLSLSEVESAVTIQDQNGYRRGRPRRDARR